MFRTGDLFVALLSTTDLSETFVMHAYQMSLTTVTCATLRQLVIECEKLRVFNIKKHILLLISQQCIVYKYSCQFKASKPQRTNIKAQADDKRSKSNPSLGCQT